jgi:hypothetical protein
MKGGRLLILIGVLVLSADKALAQFPELSRYNMGSLQYLGAFRLSNQTYGDARFAWTNGEIAVDPQSQTFFFSGSNKRSVGEFPLPELKPGATRVRDLPIVSSAIQDFSNLLGRAQSGNSESIDQIIGLTVLENKLVVNAARYYDGAASNTDTTLIVEEPDALASSVVRGFMKLEGANHAGGWLSPLPKVYADLFGYDYIAGHASNLPINSRNSMGPSAFLVSSSAILSSQTGETIPTTKLLDFSINRSLHEDLQNKSLTNDLWTELSMAEYGFVVPGTRTYLTIGSSGGHNSGIGYKITQPDGYECGGFCAYDHRDYYNYFWLWDVNDLIAASNGEILAHEIRPYSYGQFNLPFELSEDESYVENRIIGATYSAGKLYIVLGGADKLQSEFESVPMVLVYDVGDNAAVPAPPTGVSIQ